jgi:sugar lactone lactonase YvrE
MIQTDWLVFRAGEAVPSGLAVDSGNRLYVALRAGPAADARARGGTEVLRFAPDRTPAGGLRLPEVAEVHAMSLHDDALMVTDRGSHAVFVYDLDGRLRQVLGTPDHPSDTGCDTPGGPVPRPAGPFCGPTQAVRDPAGRTYVSDGYRNARVHGFDVAGRYATSWGGYGEGPGEFRLPHAIARDHAGRLLVCDRENSRIQCFDPDGRWRGEWWRTHRPTDVLVHGAHVYVSDLSARVTRLTAAGEVVAQWPVPPSAHNLCVDHDGRVYLTHIKGQSVTMITEEAG